MTLGHRINLFLAIRPGAASGSGNCDSVMANECQRDAECQHLGIRHNIIVFGFPIFPLILPGKAGVEAHLANCRRAALVAYGLETPDTFQSRTDYTVHTTNAHPKLVEPLALIADPAFLELEAAQRFLVSARARALLAESK